MKDLSIVFDLDGTLVDTAPDLMLSLYHCLDKQNYKRPAREMIYALIGSGARHMITKALEIQNANVQPEKINNMLDNFLTYYMENICVESEIFPGVLECLCYLQNRGVRMGICTNKREDLALNLLNKLELTPYFGAIVGADTLEYRKPHPNHVTGTIDLISGSHKKTIMVGDSETDIKAAQAAGIPVIAVDFGYTDKPVHTFDPDVVISHFDTLVGEIETLHQGMAGS